MKRLLVGDCHIDRIFDLMDPDAPTEQEFEFTVAKALSCAYPNYKCVVFTGSFRLEEQRHRPDLALVAGDFSHWFVLEVELASHSLERLVLPQVRAFRYGETEPDCEVILARELGVDPGRASTLVRYVPRSVAVVVNHEDEGWRRALDVNGIQMLVVSVFKARTGEMAVHLQGSLEAPAENLGFGTYSATDRSIRFPALVRLPDGAVRIDDRDGGVGIWRVTRAGEVAWITKEAGLPNIDDGAFVQLVRTLDGRISLLRPR